MHCNTILLIFDTCSNFNSESKIIIKLLANINEMINTNTTTPLKYTPQIHKYTNTQIHKHTHIDCILNYIHCFGIIAISN